MKKNEQYLAFGIAGMVLLLLVAIATGVLPLSVVYVSGSTTLANTAGYSVPNSNNQWLFPATDYSLAVQFPEAQCSVNGIPSGILSSKSRGQYYPETLNAGSGVVCPAGTGYGLVGYDTRACTCFSTTCYLCDGSLMRVNWVAEGIASPEAQGVWGQGFVPVEKNSLLAMSKLACSVSSSEVMTSAVFDAGQTVSLSQIQLRAGTTVKRFCAAFPASLLNTATNLAQSDTNSLGRVVNGESFSVPAGSQYTFFFVADKKTPTPPIAPTFDFWTSMTSFISGLVCGLKQLLGISC